MLHSPFSAEPVGRLLGASTAVCRLVVGDGLGDPRVAEVPAGNLWARLHDELLEAVVAGPGAVGAGVAVADLPAAGDLVVNVVDGLRDPGVVADEGEADAVGEVGLGVPAAAPVAVDVALAGDAGPLIWSDMPRSRWIVLRASVTHGSLHWAWAGAAATSVMPAATPATASRERVDMDGDLSDLRRRVRPCAKRGARKDSGIALSAIARMHLHK